MVPTNKHDLNRTVSIGLRSSSRGLDNCFVTRGLGQVFAVLGNNMCYQHVSWG